MQRKNMTAGVLLVAVSAAAFGIMPILAKLAYRTGASAQTLLLLRFSIAAAALFAVMLVKRPPMPSGREILAYLLLGGAGYVGQSLSYFTAINHASSGAVSLLLYTYPALVMTGSALVFREKITARKLLSLALALGGAFIIIGGDLRAEPLGVLLAFSAAGIYTVYILTSSRVIRPGMQIQSSAFIMLGAAAVFGVINGFRGFSPPTGAGGWAATLVIALFCTALAVWAFFAGMAKTGPTATSLVSTLEPVVTVLASALLLSERITAAMIVGGCLVLASLLIIVFAERKT